MLEADRLFVQKEDTFIILGMGASVWILFPYIFSAGWMKLGINIEYARTNKLISAFRSIILLHFYILYTQMGTHPYLRCSSDYCLCLFSSSLMKLFPVSRTKGKEGGGGGMRKTFSKAVMYLHIFLCNYGELQVQNTFYYYYF